jgi:aldehyde:ferredoxin oxidoreductase
MTAARHREAMTGLWGRALAVDLTRGRVSSMPIPEAWQRDHVGGRGLAARLLWELAGTTDPDPLGPANVLVFAAGPLTGIAMPGSGRHCVAARSPLSGLYGEAFAGGFWGTELRTAGWDAIVVQGKAAEPTLLAITDPEGPDAPGRAELHPAGALWGQTVSEAEEALLARWPKARVASIGQAGEHGVRFACIVNDRNRAAGRTGLGAVMGSKNLKAIVVRGAVPNVPPVADEAAFRAARKAYVATLMDEDTKNFGEFGTPGGVPYLNEFGLLPTRYWSQGSYEGAERISGQTQNATILVGRDNCSSCHVQCKRVVEADFHGEHVDKKHGGPEYETIAAFASLQGIDDLAYVAAANKWCNEYGMDTISAGSTIAFAMAAAQQGFLKDGPRFGDADGSLALLHDLAHRRGLGQLLAEGSARAAQELGCAELAVHVKGVELPMHEARGKKGLGLSYAVSPRGANHMEGAHDDELERENRAPDLGITQAMSRYQADPAKALAVRTFEDARSFVNSLVLCAFTVNHTGSTYNLGHIRDMTSAAMGFDVDRDAMLAIGERNYTLARMLSVAWGLRAEQDTLPKAVQKQELAFGPKRKEALRPAELEAMKQAYYAARGWGSDGAPTRATRARLGLP